MLRTAQPCTPMSVDSATPQIVSPTRQISLKLRSCVQDLDTARHQDFAGSQPREATKKRKNGEAIQSQVTYFLLLIGRLLWVWLEPRGWELGARVSLQKSSRVVN